MNLIDAIVTKVYSEPFEKYNKWWVDVEYNAYGVTSTSRIMSETLEEALKIDVGYKFLT